MRNFGCKHSLSLSLAASPSYVERRTCCVQLFLGSPASSRLPAQGRSKAQLIRRFYFFFFLLVHLFFFFSLLFFFPFSSITENCWMFRKKFMIVYHYISLVVASCFNPFFVQPPALHAACSHSTSSYSRSLKESTR